MPDDGDNLTSPTGSSLVRSSTIPRMLAGTALVTSFVVASDSGHKLLGTVLVANFDFGQEVLSLVASQRRCNSTVVKDLNVAILPTFVAEAKVLAT